VEASSSLAGGRGLGRDILLRAALVMPLLYVVLFSIHDLTSVTSEPGQAFSYYLVNGLLAGIPIAIWGLAVVLLVLGTNNAVAWAIVCVGGVAVSVYGLLYFLDDGRLNALLAFGLYVVLLALWTVLHKRRGDALTDWRRGDPTC
jgi:hypothetical protein